MKKIKNLIPLFLLFLLLSGCKKEESLGSVADIEDAQFLSYVLKEFDTNDDAVLSNEEIMAVTRIDCSAMGVRSLKGIEMFRNLEALICYSNRVEVLDVSKNTKLTALLCGSTAITSLDVSNNILLTYLNCDFCEFTSLDLSKNINLEQLVCSDSRLTSINLTNLKNITFINCGSNKLTSLDLSSNINLSHIACFNNPLTSLDVSNNLALNSINCTQNPDLKVLYMPKDNQNCRIEKDAHTEVVYK